MEGFSNKISKRSLAKDRWVFPNEMLYNLAWSLVSSSLFRKHKYYATLV